jgi:hypothetical protein
MSIAAFLVTPDRKFRLFAGAGHPVAWLVAMPLVAAALVRLVSPADGQLDSWQGLFASFGTIFLASVSSAGALYGAALLSLFFLAQSGLVKSPWE